MKRYESYKDSGVEWLGEVPSHWESFPLFVQAKISSITNHIDKELLSVYLDRGVVRFSDVDEKRTNVTSLDLSKYQLVRKGNLVLNNQQAWRGSVGVSSYEGIVSPAYLILELSNKFDPHYANYLFRNGSMVSHYLIASKGVGTIQRNLYWGNLRRTPIFIPPLSEQQKIAQFLDDKTAKIDQAVDLAEKQIALLKEHKQIMIQNAVTRGLNPDVPLKDSGVEWIGQVPKHWEVVSMKRVIKEHSGNGFPIDLQGNNGSIPFLKVSDFSENQDKYIFKWNNSVTNKVIKQKKWNIVPKNSIVTAKIGEALRKNHRKILSIDSIIDNNCLGIEIKKADVLFGYYLHCALDFDLFTNPGAIPSLAMDKYRNQKIALPPFQEQQQITDYLDAQTAKIDQAISLKTAHIEKLKEYKSVLINDVVTGKVRVSV